MKRDVNPLSEAPSDSASYWSRLRRADTFALEHEEQWKLMKPFLPGSGRVLDAGCGFGEWVIALRELGYDAQGIDIVQSRTEDLDARYGGFRVGDVRATGFEDASFDVVISWGVFEHFEEGFQAPLLEAYRILKPGGWVFVTVPFENIRQRRQRVSDEGRFYQWRVSRDELRRELSAAGFDACAIEPLARFAGAQRMLRMKSEPRSPLGFRAVGLAARLPADYLAHMLFAAARRT